MTDSPTRTPSDCRIAVVGAGMAGISAAQALTQWGFEVTQFERHFCPGGRMATRCRGDAQWDHGAQYFTVSDAGFAAQVEQWHRASRVSPWHGRLIELPGGGPPPFDGDITRWVPQPRMNSLAAQSINGWNLHCESEVTAARYSDGWRVRLGHDAPEQAFDRLLLATTAPQALRLLGPDEPLGAQLSEVSFAPCWAVMLEFDDTVEYGFDAAFAQDEVLAWVARDSSKPGRFAERWVLHAAGDWSLQHADRDGAWVATQLCRRLAELVSDHLPEPATAEARYWSQARVMAPLAGDQACLSDASRHLALAGDWCLDARVEAAWLSGLAAATALTADLRP